MEVKWLGHASVMLTSDSGTKIITDPFKPGYHPPPAGYLYHNPINESADIVVVTHEHADHNQVGEVKGGPEIIRSSELGEKNMPVTVKGIEFRAVSSYHDSKEGKLLGKNYVTCFEVDGIKFCHTGDLGQRLSKEQIVAIGDIDVMLLCVGLLTPVGERQFIEDEKGNRISFWKEYVVSADGANEIYSQLDSKVVMPIHYKNEKCSFYLIGLDVFLLDKKNVRRVDGSKAVFHKGELPSEREIVVVRPAL